MIKAWDARKLRLRPRFQIRHSKRENKSYKAKEKDGASRLNCWSFPYRDDVTEMNSPIVLSSELEKQWLGSFNQMN